MNFAQSSFSIIRERAYDDALLLIAKNYQRLDELDYAIEWVVTRVVEKPRPSMVEVAPNSYIWRLQGITKNFPTMVVAFSWNPDNRVISLVNILPDAP